MTEEHRINIMQDAVPSAQQGEGLEEERVPLAGVLERFVALLIDFNVVLIPYQILLIFAFRWLQPNLEQIYWLLAGACIPFTLYETIFTCGGRSTLGKMLVGVRVVDKDTSEPLGFFRAFVRALGYYLSAAPLMCGFLLAFIDSDRRALQDILAGSVVVQARPKSWGEKTLLSLCGLVILGAFGCYFYSQVFGAGSWAQQRLILRAKKHVEKIGYLEELHRIHFGSYTNDLLRLAILSGDPVQFQRDTRKALDRKDFRIGVSPEGYKIKARATDVRHTPVYYPDF